MAGTVVIRAQLDTPRGWPCAWLADSVFPRFSAQTRRPLPHEYGRNRQGFLAFSEIHPDYYQIPVADRLAILQAQTQRMMAEEDFDAVETATVPAQSSPVMEDEHAEDHAEHEHETEHAHDEAE